MIDLSIVNIHPEVFYALTDIEWIPIAICANGVGKSDKHSHRVGEIRDVISDLDLNKHLEIEKHYEDLYISARNAMIRDNTTD